MCTMYWPRYVLSLLKLLLTCTFRECLLENVFHDAGLVFRGHDPVFLVLLVVSYPKWRLRWLNKYSVGFISCSLGLLLDYVSNFVLWWEMFETHGIGCTVLLLTKVCTLAFKISWIVRKLYNIQVMRVVLFTFWPLVCHLSCWLLNLVSVLSEI